MARELLDVERMNYLMNCVTYGVAADKVCKTEGEHSFYRELLAADERLKREGASREPVSEWP